MAIKVSTPENCNYKVTRFCAGGLDDQGLPKDACNGDSGGPLLSLNSRFQSVLRGVVSFGNIGCDGAVPGIYTRVAKYIAWIKYVTSDCYRSSGCTGGIKVQGARKS